MTRHWRLLQTTEGYPEFSLGTLPAIEGTVAAGEAPAVILNVFGRDGVTIGYNEDPEQILDVGLCRALGVSFRRRMNGGGTIYAAAGSCVIAFVVPEGAAGLPSNVAHLFETVLPKVAAATERRFGIPARWRPLNDIEVEGRKLMPTSVRLENGVLTFRMMVNVKPIDTGVAARLMPMPPEKVRDKVHKDLGSRFTCLERELGREVAAGELLALTRDVTSALFGDVALVDGEPTAREMADAEAPLARTGADDWAFGRSEAALFGPFQRAGDVVGRGREKAPGGMIWAALLVRGGRIVRAIVNGDFPARPVDAPTRLEALLEGTPASEESVRAIIDAFMADDRFELAGVSAEALMVALGKALDAAATAQRHQGRI